MSGYNAIMIKTGTREVENKLADFEKMVREAKESGAQAVLVPSPQTLGGSYEEVILNLTKLQEAGMPLFILPAPKPKK